MMEEITVDELNEKMEANEHVFLLDVREPFEQYQSKIDYENSQLIPLGELPERLDEVKAHEDEGIVCMCRSGGRSARACQFLEKEGLENVKSLKGGINQWAKDIDPSLPVY